MDNYDDFLVFEPDDIGMLKDLIFEIAKYNFS